MWSWLPYSNDWIPRHLVLRENWTGATQIFKIWPRVMKHQPFCFRYSESKLTKSAHIQGKSKHSCCEKVKKLWTCLKAITVMIILFIESITRCNLLICCLGFFICGCDRDCLIILFLVISLCVVGQGSLFFYSMEEYV